MPVFQQQLTPDEVWDIAHYVESLRIQAHARELVAAGLKPADRSASLADLWASLSDSVQRGRLDQGVIQTELAQLAARPLTIAQAPTPPIEGVRP